MTHERDVHITPVMIREALRILYRSGRLVSEVPGVDELLLEEMLQAALRPVAGEMKPWDPDPREAIIPKHVALGIGLSNWR
jgi:hypothetical protein